MTMACSKVIFEFGGITVPGALCKVREVPAVCILETLANIMSYACFTVSANKCN